MHKNMDEVSHRIIDREIRVASTHKYYREFNIESPVTR